MSKTTLTFSPLAMKRKTKGFIKHADRGIRAKVVAMLVASGSVGCSNDELSEGAWPTGQGTAKKVGECMNILAGDTYGYTVERAVDASNRGKDQYRLVLPDGYTIPARAPKSSKKSAPAPDAPGSPSEGADAKPDAPTEIQLQGWAKQAVASGNVNSFVKEHVPDGHRGVVRNLAKELRKAAAAETPANA